MRSFRGVLGSTTTREYTYRDGSGLRRVLGAPGLELGQVPRCQAPANSATPSGSEPRVHPLPHQEEEAGADQPEVAAPVPIDVEVLSREVGIRVQDLQGPLQGQAGEGLTGCATWKVPSLGPSTTKAIHHTKPSPSLDPRGSCSSLLSDHFLPIQLQHPEQAQVEQGTELTQT